MLIVNDVHLGAVRKGGTTPATQAAIRGYLQQALRDHLAVYRDNHLIVNGDLFDQFSVEPAEVVRAYETFADWLNDDPERRLALGRGNHDWHPSGGRLSSFDLLAHFLVSRFSADRVQVITEGYTRITDDVWMIPHMPNQDLFDMEIAKAVKEASGTYLLLHCNYCSTFAEHSDHSLNISASQVTALASAGWHLILGHEHQHRELPHATIVGNQWPSSISDCLGHGSAQRDGSKYALEITGLKVVRTETWRAATDYIEMDWRELDTEATQRFIRVTGDASAAEAEAAMSAIAKFRQKSAALVIGNAVKVEGVSVIEGFDGNSPTIGEVIKSFDVLAALLQELSVPEAEVVRGLMK